MGTAAPFASVRPVTEVLDEARAELASLAPRVAGSGQRTLERAAAGLVWAGGWLDPPYQPCQLAPVPGAPDAADGPRRLRLLADRLEELIEAFETDDPVRHADAIQACGLAFAVLGATAARLDRDRAALDRPHGTPGLNP